MKYKWINLEDYNIFMGLDDADQRTAVKKDILGWRVVNPRRNEDGKVNTVNLWFGGWKNLLTTVVILLIIGLGVYGFKETTDSCLHFAKDPCKFVCCPNCDEINLSMYDNRTLRWLSLTQSSLNISI